MSVFLCENRNNSLEAGREAPSRWQIFAVFQQENI